MAKKQNITITGRAANNRVEAAIPKFQAQGMAKDQATAVAIRMESVGRLVDNPKSGRLNVIPKNTPYGVPMTAPRGSAAIMAMALTAKPQPTKTKQRNNTAIQANSFDDLQRQTRRSTKKLTAKRATRRTTRRRK